MKKLKEFHALLDVAAKVHAIRKTMPHDKWLWVLSIVEQMQTGKRKKKSATPTAYYRIETDEVY